VNEKEGERGEKKVGKSFFWNIEKRKIPVFG
jgi:hypothetical protein